MRKIGKGQLVLGQVLVAAAVVAGSIAFTTQSKVMEVKGLYFSELQSRLERAKEREAYLRSIGDKLGGASNVVEMYSVVQDMREIIKDAVSLAVEQQMLIELQIEEAAKGAHKK